MEFFWRVWQAADYSQKDRTKSMVSASRGRFLGLSSARGAGGWKRGTLSAMVRLSVVREAGARVMAQIRRCPRNCRIARRKSRRNKDGASATGLIGWEGATKVPRSSQETSTDARFVGRLGGRKGPHPWQPNRLAPRNPCHRSPWCWAGHVPARAALPNA